VAARGGAGGVGPRGGPADRLEKAGAAASRAGHRDAAARIAEIVIEEATEKK
jgi:hypothetical protein